MYKVFLLMSVFVLALAPLSAAQADGFGPRFMSVAPIAMDGTPYPYVFRASEIEPAAGIETPQDVQSYVEDMFGEDMSANNRIYRQRASDNKSRIKRIYAEPL